MARKGKGAKTEAGRDPMARIADLVALLLVKGESQPEKVRSLAAVGYTPSEISGLLGITANAVSITLHRLKKAK